MWIMGANHEDIYSTLRNYFARFCFNNINNMTIYVLDLYYIPCSSCPCSSRTTLVHTRPNTAILHSLTGMCQASSSFSSIKFILASCHMLMISLNYLTCFLHVFWSEKVDRAIGERSYRKGKKSNTVCRGPGPVTLSFGLA